MNGWIAMAVLIAAPSAWAQIKCPAASALPQLTIDYIENPAIPVFDEWQIFFDDMPLSDAQLAIMARNDRLIDRTREEMKDRGNWVYLGMGVAAAGAALQSIGWVLYGQNEQPQKVTIPLAVTGLVITMAGFLMVTQFIQDPLEPHLAPTPQHRLTRREARHLVSNVNKRLRRDICAAAAESNPPQP